MRRHCTQRKRVGGEKGRVRGRTRELEGFDDRRRNLGGVEAVMSGDVVALRSGEVILLETALLMVVVNNVGDSSGVAGIAHHADVASVLEDDDVTLLPLIRRRHICRERDGMEFEKLVERAGSSIIDVGVRPGNIGIAGGMRRDIRINHCFEVITCVFEGGGHEVGEAPLPDGG